MNFFVKKNFFMTTTQNIRLLSYHKITHLFCKKHVDKVDKSVHKFIFRQNGDYINVDN